MNAELIIIGSQEIRSWKREARANKPEIKRRRALNSSLCACWFGINSLMILYLAWMFFHADEASQSLYIILLSVCLALVGLIALVNRVLFRRYWDTPFIYQNPINVVIDASEITIDYYNKNATKRLEQKRLSIDDIHDVSESQGLLSIMIDRYEAILIPTARFESRQQICELLSV